MRLLRLLALAVAALTMTVGTAMAQTTVRWLHIEANPAQVKICLLYTSDAADE